MSDKKIVIMLADGFEEVEAVTTVDLLRRAAFDIKTVSIMDRRKVSGAHGIPVTADLMFEDVDFGQVDMIILPGGMPGTTNLLECGPLKEQLLAFASGGKNVAAICAAPMVLAAHGILEGKKATIYEGMEEHLKGAVHTPGNVVIDGNITTSKGPGTAMDFALSIIAQLAGEEKSAEVQAGLLYRK